MGNGIPDDDLPEPPRLRQLRWLVNTLTITLIAGFLVVVAAIVIRLSRAPALPALPDAVAIPAGETAGAVTFGTGWVAVVTRDAAGTERIRLFDSGSGAGRGSLEIRPGG